ncbi:hypothetical protein Hypma_016596 [Hypsizygus marmoreus]|uniref:Uncharacterized protein n=1 Tax=Hypsizygus marmoreus TaxID=39966 RepID=A0A369J6Q9_HYPMA|nr:hypothetical protein Hypma_016596 [Hypsizygus marmoreus]
MRRRMDVKSIFAGVQTLCTFLWLHFPFRTLPEPHEGRFRNGSECLNYPSPSLLSLYSPLDALMMAGVSFLNAKVATNRTASRESLVFF